MVRSVSPLSSSAYSVLRSVPLSSPSADVPIAVPGLRADDAFFIDRGVALPVRTSVLIFDRSALSMRGRSPAEVERNVAEEAFDMPR